jgi:hypothetical protein
MYLNMLKLSEEVNLFVKFNPVWLLSNNSKIGGKLASFGLQESKKLRINKKAPSGKRPLNLLQLNILELMTFTFSTTFIYSNF